MPDSECVNSGGETRISEGKIMSGQWPELPYLEGDGNVLYQ